MEHVNHTFEPVYNGKSEILILGTFPSVKSREVDFYYSHPQNRFWKLIGAITGCENYSTVEEKKKMLLDNKIAVWDTIASCDIVGSSDASITNVVPVDLSKLLKETNIKKIYTNGSKAYELYKKYLQDETGIKAISLPSTSPANARYSLDKLLEKWRVIRD